MPGQENTKCKFFFFCTFVWNILFMLFVFVKHWALHRIKFVIDELFYVL